MKISKLILAASALVFASVALADDDGPPAFEKADTNGDGFVDTTEFGATKLDMDFGEFDANGDGKMNKAEYEEAVNSECA